VVRLLGDYYGSGNLVVRVITVENIKWILLI
jgi:hypothetical protein